MSYFGSTNTFREGTFRSLHIVSFTANCPKGTKGTSKGCTECGIGYYQDKEGATECKKCPVGTTSKENGSRDFIQCQGKEKKF